MDSGGRPMSQADAPATSLTLLDCLGRPADDREGRTAWGEFAVRYERTIRTWCRRWGAQESDADDLIQQLLLGIRETIRGYDPRKGRFRAWFWVVTRNAYTNLVTRRPGAAPPCSGRTSPPATTWSRRSRRQRAELLQAALGRVQARRPGRLGHLPRAELRRTARRGRRRPHGRTVAAVLMVKSRVLKKVKEQIAELGGDDHEWANHP